MLASPCHPLSHPWLWLCPDGPHATGGGFTRANAWAFGATRAVGTRHAQPLVPEEHEAAVSFIWVRERSKSVAYQRIEYS